MELPSLLFGVPHYVENAFRAIGRRNDFATTHPALPATMAGQKAIANLLSTSSASGHLGTYELVSTSRAHQESGEYNREVSRLQRQYVPSLTASPADVPSRKRSTIFGHTTVVGDNTQGRCQWSVFPTTLPSDFDESIKEWWDLGTDGASPGTGAMIQFWDSHLIMRNMASAKCEVDVWLAWPKFDVPNKASTPYTQAFFVLADGTYGASPLISDSYQATQMPLHASYSANAPFSTEEIYVYNDWNANPHENPVINELFTLQHKKKLLMNPGDEAECTWGLPSIRELSPFSDLLTNPGVPDVKTLSPYQDNYALMKRNGPLVIMRVRGRLVHDESKQGANPGTAGNFGLFNLEWALIRQMQTFPMETTMQYLDADMATIPMGGAPPSVNQSTAGNSQAWFQQPVTESAALT